MATTIVIPDFSFSGFYYPQLLESLIQYKRINIPEATDESATEPLIQIIRAFALVGHMNNVTIDLVANETTLPTAKLQESVRNILRLIDYELAPAAPSQADLIYELSKVFAASFEIVPLNSQVATENQGEDNPAVFFEALAALTMTRGDLFTYVLAEEDGVFTDVTTEGNTAGGGNELTPWASPVSKDAIYWGHDTVMWNELSIALDAGGEAANISGVFEYYDGNLRVTAPSSVTDLGGTLEFDLTTLLGTQNRQGTQVRVQLNSSTAFEDLETTWNGSENIVTTTGLLGQTTPSTDETEYTVGSLWVILEDALDGSALFTADGQLTYDLPQTVVQNWRTAEIDGKTAFWLRFRITVVSTPTGPVFDRFRMDEGKQYVHRQVTQGRARTDDPLGSSTGLVNQRFATTKDFFIQNSETVTVDSEIWQAVDNFLNSGPGDRHYVVELGVDDRATIIFGDGATGRIPALGVGNIAISYRYGANDDGNVGPNKITIDKTGLTFVNKMHNPRQAVGWSEAQGSTEASLERAKVEGPASIRTKDVAISPSDIVSLTVAFVSEDGASPFSRAETFEEGFGPKTVEIVVVASGGGLATNDQLAELDEYFNGNKFTNPQLPKRIVANQEVTSVNHDQRVVDITATVYGETTVADVTNRLQQVFQPEALKDDGITLQWNFADKIPRSRISHEIFETDESITEVVIAIPAADIQLGQRELPIAGTISITVVTP